MINSQAVPKNATVTVENKGSFAATAGDLKTSSSVVISKLALPEFSCSLHVRNIKCCVFENESAPFDIVLGCDFLKTAGIGMQLSTQSVKWMTVGQNQSFCKPCQWSHNQWCICSAPQQSQQPMPSTNVLALKKSLQGKHIFLCNSAMTFVECSSSVKSFLMTNSNWCSILGIRNFHCSQEGWRSLMVSGFRKLSQAVNHQQCPLPEIQDVVCKQKPCKCLTRIDTALSNLMRNRENFALPSPHLANAAVTSHPWVFVKVLIGLEQP